MKARLFTKNLVSKSRLVGSANQNALSFAAKFEIHFNFVQPEKDCPETPQTPKPRGDRDVKNKMVIAWRGTELSTEDGFDKDDVLQDAKIQKGMKKSTSQKARFCHVD